MDAFYEMMKPENVPYGVSAPDGEFSPSLSFLSLSLSLCSGLTSLSLT